MSDLCRLIWCALIGLFRSRAALEAENVVLRHQLNVLRRKSPKRVAVSSIDRLLLVGLYRLAPGILEALKIIRPETLALEVPTARRSAGDSSGHSPAHSRDERRKPALGRAADTRRAAQARHRCRTDDSCEVHGQEASTAVAGLEDLP